VIDQLRRHGLIRVTVEQKGDLWEARLSTNTAGQGDFVSRDRSPDSALRAACSFFGDMGSRHPRKAAPAPAPVAVDAIDGTDLI